MITDFEYLPLFLLSGARKKLQLAGNVYPVGKYAQKKLTKVVQQAEIHIHILTK